MNIISRHDAVPADSGAVGREFARLLRADTLDLPVLPDSAARIAALSGSPPARAAALAEIVSDDRQLSRQVMKVGRLATGEPGLRLDTLPDVIGWIGPAEAGDIAYTASLQAALLSEPPQQEPARQLWKLGIAAAIWAREAATLARRRSRWTYTCGLLHDIGKPVTALACGKLAVQLGVVLDEAATAALVHEHHLAVAEHLVHRWRLPEAVARCIHGWHDWQDSAESGREEPAVWLGHHLAELVAGQGAEFAREALAADPVLDLLNIGPDRFRGLASRAGWVTSQVEAY